MKELDGRRFLDLFGGRSLKNAVAKVPGSYFKLSLVDLEKQAAPTQADMVLKNQFWCLIDEHAFRKDKIRISEIHTDVFTYQWFYHGFLKNPAKVAWILRIKFTPNNEFEFTNHLVIHELNRAIRAYWDIPAEKWPAHHLKLLIKAFIFLADFFPVDVTNTRR